ncbi:hypothetical protein LSUE1_G000833 [Lachnellula suecica]|uniref:HTH APSES-type domain-containing protein n=1 Tax=Lachnellula suecica TaxID=602035 RepID=A0A8T9CI25_9HELO|nr:hypothetical protein LSUE1_G000833 [Lachnellula suecica]
MLPLASLLNPVRSEPRGPRLPSSPPSSLRTSSSTHGSPLSSTQSLNKKPKMTKDGAIFAKGKIKGEVNYPPFENLDEGAMREVQKFQVYPLGTIQEYCRHIPYNSEKKSFLEKTGRESFEVFQYIFKVPGDDKDYTVMWDYNIGLVRITPFFKCCKYSKTTPAKMLNMNPGLKEITHSITGGALAAQGYWMPFSCALAVCTTFCAHIAGALIPIFGPTFPSLCVPQEAPEHGRWSIEPSIVVEATAEAESYRAHYSGFSTKPSRESYSPQRRMAEPLDMRTTPPNSLGRRLRLKRTFGGDSPYGTPTDTDLETNGSETSSADGYFCSPVTPVSASSLSQQHNWQTHNMISHSANSSINVSPHKQLAPGPNPILSAIPRSTGLVDVPMGGMWPTSKRRADEVDADEEYDGGESANLTDDKTSDTGKDSDKDMDDASIGGAEKKAAWLLMNLSVKDGECGAEATRDRDMLEGPRIKRRRATSM